MVLDWPFLSCARNCLVICRILCSCLQMHHLLQWLLFFEDLILLPRRSDRSIAEVGLHTKMFGECLQCVKSLVRTIPFESVCTIGMLTGHSRETSWPFLAFSMSRKRQGLGVNEDSCLMCLFMPCRRLSLCVTCGEGTLWQYWCVCVCVCVCVLKCKAVN